MKKIAALLIVLSILIGGCAKTSGEVKTSSDNQKLQKINIGYLAVPGHALYFIAKEKGFFKEEGLDAELFHFNNSGEGLNALKAGKIDVGSFGTAAPLVFISKGNDFTIFGGQQTEGHGLVAKPEKAAELSDLKNFKGKTVATVRLATGDVVLRGALKNIGLDWKKDLRVLEFDTPAAVLEAVKKGSVDAGVVWTPYITLAEKQGLKVVKYSGELFKLHPCCRQVTTTVKLKAAPELYTKMMRALIKAYAFYQTNHEQTIDIISKYVKVDKDILAAETYGGHLFSIPDPDKKGVQEFWKFMNNAGYISSNLDISEKIDTDIYQNALKSLIKEEPGNKTYKELEANFHG